MSNLEKAGPLGVIIPVLSCPACFPAFAGLSSALGLGFLQVYDREILMAMQVFIILSMVLSFYTFKRNKYKPTLILILLSGILMLGAWNISYISAVFYTGMAGLMIGSIWNVIIDRKIPSCKDGVCNTR